MISKTIVEGIAEDSNVAFKYAKFLIENGWDGASKTIVEAIVKDPDNAFKYAKFLIENQCPISDILRKKVNLDKI
jgi:hypothetical protein